MTPPPPLPAAPPPAGRPTTHRHRRVPAASLRLDRPVAGPDGSAVAGPGGNPVEGRGSVTRSRVTGRPLHRPEDRASGDPLEGGGPCRDRHAVVGPDADPVAGRAPARDLGPGRTSWRHPVKVGASWPWRRAR